MLGEKLALPRAKKLVTYIAEKLLVLPFLLSTFCSLSLQVSETNTLTPFLPTCCAGSPEHYLGTVRKISCPKWAKCDHRRALASGVHTRSLALCSLLVPFPRHLPHVLTKTQTITLRRYYDKDPPPSSLPNFTPLKIFTSN